MDHPLEPDPATQRAWLDAGPRVVFAHLANLDSAPAMGPTGAEGRRIGDEVSVPIPEEPLPGGAEAALARVARGAEAALHTTGPGYLAYIPGGGLYTAALADFVAGVLNRFTGLAPPAPALVRLEADVLAWLAREFGYATEAAGVFTSGGSLANFSAIVTARQEHVGEQGDLRQAVAYTSTQAHHSVARSLRLAGLPAANVRTVPVDVRFRLDVARLREAVRADRARGLRPFLVVGSAGTTNTGAIDPLPELAVACAEQGLWLHVDAAYGGAFVLCPQGRARLAGIERADSITFDPHKGMFLPYGTGCLLVRDGAKLRRAHESEAHYLQDLEAMGGAGASPSPGEHGPELSRPYRGLRVWLPLMLHGARAFRDALAEKLALTDVFHQALTQRMEAGLPVEIVDAPQLSVVAFRSRRRPGEPLGRWNQRNAAFLSEINGRKRVCLSSTLLPVADGAAYTLRVCVVSFRTHQDRIETCLEDVERAAREVERL